MNIINANTNGKRGLANQQLKNPESNQTKLLRGVVGAIDNLASKVSALDQPDGIGDGLAALVAELQGLRAEIRAATTQEKPKDKNWCFRPSRDKNGHITEIRAVKE